MKPDDPDLVAKIEQVAKSYYQREIGDHYFTFFFDISQLGLRFDPIGKLKTWIIRSRRQNSKEWREAKAVVLSYRGKKTLRLNVVVQGDEQAYQLTVNLKSGQLNWKPLNTQEAAQLKEALKVAQR